MKMKTLGILAGFLGIAAIGSATTVSCGATPPSQVVATVGAGPSSYSFSCDGLTFSNFTAVDAGGTTGLPVDLVSATYDTVTGEVDLNFNPFMYNSVTTPLLDMWFYYQVSGPIYGLDLSNGGVGPTSISEIGCSTPIDTVHGNGCSGQDATHNYVLGSVNLIASSQSGVVFNGGNPVTNPVYIFKDIVVGSSPVTYSDAHLTSFGQSFHTSVVPEPVTFSLMGVGLLGLGLLRKRIR